mmetsp:Transcript_46320/g.83725  ORF Transcript_46320/g.83725 Transcript_46320/m.83725 type:complete len:299 (-) Transcript_46320:69-965(-)
MTLRYDGKVAIVTGAGTGLGKEYAMLLASRGAKVVVNDLGGSLNGTGTSSAAADNVVAEIQAAGGEAVANYDSVVSGEKIVKTAVDTYGRVDILINNAGILRDVTFKKMTDKDWELIYEVHMKGVYAMTKAAWPYMSEQKYGRLVNVSSPSGLYGQYGQVNYSAMKSAVIGFTRALALEGAKANIKVNIIAPLAASRMLETATAMKAVLAHARSEHIATYVAYFAHESCEPSGGIFEIAGNVARRLRWQSSGGVNFPDKFTPEDVAAKIGDISDFDRNPDYPPDAANMIARVLQAAKL